MTGYDIIGDIHANAEGLRHLLAELGYRGPNFIHPDGRVPIYLGDFIDRGPENRKVIEIVQKTMENGAESVLGDHEFKAICYSRPGIHEHIRPHTFKNAAEHAGFLDEYPYGTSAYNSVIRWFETLPVYIQKPGFRVIHACWHENALNVCAPYIRKKDGALKESAYEAYDTENPTAFSDALDILLNGPRYNLPRGVTYIGSDGVPGKKAGILWWKDKALRPHRLIEKGEQVSSFLSSENKKALVQLINEFNYASKDIVFIGHFDILNSRNILSPKVACLNFRGHMAAYRWNHGDKKLDPAQLIWL